jgi:hypothetical protein
MSNCDQCHGCALKHGAKANQEAQNHLTAILSVVSGTPFHCHEKLGWTPDKDGYPNQQEQIYSAVNTLMAAPRLIHDSPELAGAHFGLNPNGVPSKLFDEERAIIGKRPVCGGWKQQVKALADQGWYRNKEVMQVRKAMAMDAFHWMAKLRGAEKSEKPEILEAIEKVVFWFRDEIKDAGIKPGTLFSREKELRT